MLFLSQDPAGTEEHLLTALQSAHFEVTHTSNVLRAQLADYQLVVFNNWNLEALPAAHERCGRAIREAGRRIAGHRRRAQRYVEGKKVEDAMDRALPAKLAPPRSPEGTCVVLIMDKSSSMEGRKMELARLSGIGVIENLRPTDNVGVLIFDNSFQWAVPIRKAEDKTADQAPDCRRHARWRHSDRARAWLRHTARFRASTRTYRHVVLLTDGISEEGDSISVAKDAMGKRITISTVGLGPGRESRVSREGRAACEGTILLPDRSRRDWSRS